MKPGGEKVIFEGKNHNPPVRLKKENKNLNIYQVSKKQKQTHTHTHKKKKLNKRKNKTKQKQIRQQQQQQKTICRLQQPDNQMVRPLHTFSQSFEFQNVMFSAKNHLENFWQFRITV